jgi:hypothetical protein
LMEVIFWRNRCLHFHGTNDSIQKISIMFIQNTNTIYQTTWHHAPKHCSLHSHHSKTLISHIFRSFTVLQSHVFLMLIQHTRK